MSWNDPQENHPSDLISLKRIPFRLISKALNGFPMEHQQACDTDTPNMQDPSWSNVPESPNEDYLRQRSTSRSRS